jgi:hypothetical protein
MSQIASKILLLLSLMLSLQSQAQFVEVGVGGGASSYIGDLNPGGFFTNTSVGGQAFLTYNWHPNFATRVNLLRAQILADDTRSPDPEIRLRNLSFRSSIWELSLIQEVNLISFRPDQKKETEVFAPYLFAGLGLFYFNPQAYYQQEWVDLQPLGTEGQGLAAFPDRNPYKLFQMAILMGGGVKLALTPRFNVGFEFGHRFTFTDYLDDVSTTYVAERDLEANGPLAVALANRTEEYTGIPADDFAGERRGNSNNKDAYLYWGVRFSFNFFGKKAYKKEIPEYEIYKWF